MRQACVWVKPGDPYPGLWRAAPLSKAGEQASAAHLWPPERCFLSIAMGTLWGIWQTSPQQKLREPGYSAAMETQRMLRAQENSRPCSQAQCKGQAEGTIWGSSHAPDPKAPGVVTKNGSAHCWPRRLGGGAIWPWESAAALNS